MGYKHGPIVERFMAMVSPEPNSGCWLWTGSTNLCGYGQFCVVRSRPIGAHRAAMHLLRGMPIRPGRDLQFDHLCRNKLCVNPDHLELVTARENVRRALAYRRSGGRRAVSARPLCGSGESHAAGANLYVAASGRRDCRMCRAIRYERWARIHRAPYGQVHRSATHCPAGHPKTTENTRLKPNGHKECWPCRRARRSAHNQKHRRPAPPCVNTTGPQTASL